DGMSDLKAFFAQNVESDLVTEVVVSKRFKDAEGNPIKWKIKPIGEEENAQYRKESTKRVQVRKGVFTQETDNEAYIGKLVEACVVFPNLKDADLQKSYNVMGADQLIKRMLLPGEYGTLVQEIQKINGFDLDIEETIDEIKN